MEIELKVITDSGEHRSINLTERQLSTIRHSCWATSSRLLINALDEDENFQETSSYRAMQSVDEIVSKLDWLRELRGS